MTDDNSQTLVDIPEDLKDFKTTFYGKDEPEAKEDTGDDTPQLTKTEMPSKRRMKTPLLRSPMTLKPKTSLMTSLRKRISQRTQVSVRSLQLRHVLTS
jgi:hypothetical protein